MCWLSTLGEWALMIFGWLIFRHSILESILITRSMIHFQTLVLLPSPFSGDEDVIGYAAGLLKCHVIFCLA